MTDIIIEGEFIVKGIGALKHFSQPLKYLKLRVAYPPPPIQVEAMKSFGFEKGKISEFKKIKESELTDKSTGAKKD